MGIKIRKTEDLPQMQELFLGQGKGEGLKDGSLWTFDTDNRTCFYNFK